MGAVDRHAQPVRSLFARHRLDALSHFAHLVAIPHRRQHAKEEPERERGMLVHGHGNGAPARRAPVEADAGSREMPQHALLHELENLVAVHETEIPAVLADQTRAFVARCRGIARAVG